jgi:hypothetical protein
MSELRKYGASATIPFRLFKLDGSAFEPGAVFAAGDVKIMSDEGVEANTANLPTDEGQGYSIVLTATEMQAARIVIYLVDQTGPQVWLDTSIAIATYGNASSQHAFDLDSATAAADVVAISGDTTAADNLESQYDTTGLTGDSFPSTQAQVGAISVGSSTISIQAESYVLTTGVQSSGTFADTATVDGVHHEHTDTAGVIDLYYQFDVTGNGTASSAQIDLRINGSNDSITVYAFDWGASDWDQIDFLAGTNGSIDSVLSPDLLIRHTGTGANLGKVRIRFEQTGLTSATLLVDRIITSYAVVSQSVGYADGAIWVDTLNGAAGITPFVNGVADNAVLTWADALTLSGLVGLTRFRFVNGSSITLTGVSDNYALIGDNWSLALGGQGINGLFAQGANSVTGTGANGGTMPRFQSCLMGDVSLPPVELLACCLSGDFIATAAGDFHFVRCHSLVAGNATPSFDFGALNANQNVNFRGYAGGIEFKNMGQAGTDAVSLEGHGQYVLNANCTGGSMRVSGHFDKTDNSGGAVALTETARYDQDQISRAAGVIRNATAQGSGTGSNQIQLDAAASATDGAYDPAIIAIMSGTGTGQTRLILQYNGTTKTATVDRNWKVNPDSTSVFNIVADPGREHVNEGLAQAGSATTITLNALASATDDAYNGQTVFIRSGTGDDQARRVTDYNGTTKVATVSKAWGTSPDTTSAYVMLPLSLSPIEEISTAVMAGGDVDGFTLEETLKLLLSAATGVLAGAATNSITIKAADGSKTRITGTVDADGNRTVVVRDATG